MSTVCSQGQPDITPVVETLRRSLQERFPGESVTNSVTSGLVGFSIHHVHVGQTSEGTLFVKVAIGCMHTFITIFPLKNEEQSVPNIPIIMNRVCAHFRFVPKVSKNAQKSCPRDEVNPLYPNGPPCRIMAR